MEDYKYIAQDFGGKIHIFHFSPYTGSKHDEWFGHGDRYLFLFNGKENPEWKETLVDLSKDNYKIENGILTRTTKEEPKNPHQPMIDEWEASGRTKVVQFYLNDKLCTCDNGEPKWFENVKYRFKPEVVRYRNAACNSKDVGVFILTAYDDENVCGIEKYTSFIEWIDTEWQEYEIKR